MWNQLSRMLLFVLLVPGVIACSGGGGGGVDGGNSGGGTTTVEVTVRSVFPGALTRLGLGTVADVASVTVQVLDKASGTAGRGAPDPGSQRSLCVDGHAHWTACWGAAGLYRRGL